MFIVCIFIGMAVLAGIYLDVIKKINLLHKSVMSLFLIFMPHISLINIQHRRKYRKYGKE